MLQIDFGENMIAMKSKLFRIHAYEFESKIKIVTLFNWRIQSQDKEIEERDKAGHQIDFDEQLIKENKKRNIYENEKWRTMKWSSKTKPPNRP